MFRPFLNMSPDYEKAAAETILLLGGCLGNTVLKRMRKEGRGWEKAKPEIKELGMCCCQNPPPSLAL